MHSYRATMFNPAMFKANEGCYNQTFGLYGLEALNHRSELKILWDTFRSQIAELWFPYDRRIAGDRRRSQKIEPCSIFCDRLRSRSQDRRRSQTIAELSAIRDRLRSYGNQPLDSHKGRQKPLDHKACFGSRRIYAIHLNEQFGERTLSYLTFNFNAQWQSEEAISEVRSEQDIARE